MRKLYFLYRLDEIIIGSSNNCYNRKKIKAMKISEYKYLDI